MEETITETDMHPDGQDLDRLVAERIFGWERVGGQTNLAPFAYKRPDGHVVHPYSAPRYSESIEAAMEVVEKMRADKWDIQITSDDESPAWRVSFDARGMAGKLLLGEYESDTLSLAICRAALEAIRR